MSLKVYNYEMQLLLREKNYYDILSHNYEIELLN